MSKPATKSGKHLFVELCEAVNAYAAENAPDVPRSVEEIEAIVFANLSAWGKVVGDDEASAGLFESARRRLSVPADKRTYLND